jgi:predicted transcriptional regulator
MEITMGTVTITLSDERLAQLKETARRLGVTPEDLARASVEDLLRLPDETFRRTLDRILDKNADLYRWLASS